MVVTTKRIKCETGILEEQSGLLGTEWMAETNEDRNTGSVRNVVCEAVAHSAGFVNRPSYSIAN
jgi:hypothetical protein